MLTVEGRGVGRPMTREAKNRLPTGRRQEHQGQPSASSTFPIRPLLRRFSHPARTTFLGPSHNPIISDIERVHRYNARRSALNR